MFNGVRRVVSCCVTAATDSFVTNGTAALSLGSDTEVCLSLSLGSDDSHRGPFVTTAPLGNHTGVVCHYHTTW